MLILKEVKHLCLTILLIKYPLLGEKCYFISKNKNIVKDKLWVYISFFNYILYIMNKLSIKELKKLKEKIDALEMCEHVELLKIFIKNDVKYTENSNGIFINMSKLSNNCIEDINKFMDFINNNLNNI
jgi:hypothetical protein